MIQNYLALSVTNIEVQPFENIEVALHMLYLAGEAVTDKVITTLKTRTTHNIVYLVFYIAVYVVTYLLFMSICWKPLL